MDWKIGVSFLVISATSLFPYNLFMNAHEYFYYKLRNVSNIDNSTYFLPLAQELQTPFQRDFEGYLSVFGGVACIIGAALNLVFTNMLSNTSRVVGGHIVVLAVFIPTIIYTYADTDETQSVFFYTSLVLASMASFGSLGLIAGGVMGLAATYPTACMQCVVGGQAVAGILSSILSIVCQAFTSSAVINGRIYFVIAVIWTIVSLILFMYLASVTATRDAAVTENSRVEDHQRLMDEQDDDESSDTYAAVPNVSSKQQYATVVMQSRVDLLAIALCLLITISGFPAVSSLVASTSKNKLWTQYFTAICCFLTFNMGDACGRLLATRITLNGTRLLIFSCLRVGFIPLIIVCNVEPRFYLPTLLPYDGVYLLVMLLFAISHGFTISLGITGVTKSVDPELREVSGSLLNLACVSSALIGSFAGVGLVKVL